MPNQSVINHHNELFAMLKEMRQQSPVGGALGQMSNLDIEKLIKGAELPRLSRAHIHNLGVLYGRPLSEEEIAWFERRLLKNFVGPDPAPESLSTNRPLRTREGRARARRNRPPRSKRPKHIFGTPVDAQG
jgi:hypothetical protein